MRSLAPNQPSDRPNIGTSARTPSTTQDDSLVLCLYRGLWLNLVVVGTAIAHVRPAKI